MDTMLTVEEVAEILKVKPITVRQMYREKRLRAFKMGKAWRTTLPMLEEDIARISRGEKPPALSDTLEGSEPAPRRPRRTAKPNAAADTPAPSVEVSAPEPVEEAAPTPAAPEDVMPSAAAEEPVPYGVEPATVSEEAPEEAPEETPEEAPEKGRKRRAKDKEPEEASDQQLLF